MAIRTIQGGMLAGQGEKGMQRPKAAGREHHSSRVDQAPGQQAQTSVQSGIFT